MTKIHVQFKNSCKKRQKCIFNFEIHTKKKAKMINELQEKMIFLNFFFLLLSLMPIFNLKIYAKKTKMQKKANTNFQIRKIYKQKRLKILFLKKLNFLLY